MLRLFHVTLLCACIDDAAVARHIGLHIGLLHPLEPLLRPLFITLLRPCIDDAAAPRESLLAQLALKDEAIAQAQAAVAEKDAALAAAVAEKDAALGAEKAEKAEKDAALAEVAELRAQLSRLEGVPPPVQTGR